MHTPFSLCGRRQRDVSIKTVFTSLIQGGAGRERGTSEGGIGRDTRGTEQEATAVEGGARAGRAMPGGSWQSKFKSPFGASDAETVPEPYSYAAVGIPAPRPSHTRPGLQRRGREGKGKRARGRGQGQEAGGRATQMLRLSPQVAVGPFITWAWPLHHPLLIWPGAVHRNGGAIPWHGRRVHIRRGRMAGPDGRFRIGVPGRY